jgi:hypothetical protein
MRKDGSWNSLPLRQVKPAKLALTAPMRKLIVLVNALLRASRTWTPKLA